MATALLLDAETVVLAIGGKLRSVPLSGLGRAVSGPTDVVVVASEVTRVVAANEPALERHLATQFDASWVTCHETVDGPVRQVFSMQLDLLKSLRAIPQVRAVIPYAVVIREGERTASLSWTDMLKRPTTVIRRDAVAAVDETRMVGVLDVLGDKVVVTAIAGAEIRAQRVLQADDDLEREVFVTLQGAQLPDARLVTPAADLAERLRAHGHDIDVLELPPEAPALGLVPLRRASPAVFLLPEELADRRKAAASRRERRSVIVSVTLAGMMIALASAAWIRQTRLESRLASVRSARDDQTTKLMELYRTRYASEIATTTPHVPRAWAELELVMPSQLQIESVRATPNGLEAVLKRRATGADDVGNPPVKLRDIRAALAKCQLWKGAKARTTFDSHAIGYILEASL